MVRVEFGKARCRFHGGLSTGPKTEAGRARIAEAQRRRWCLYRERQSAGSDGDRSPPARDRSLNGDVGDKSVSAYAGDDAIDD
jgi:hypothetical protein